MHEGNILQFGTINDLLHDKKFKWPIKPNHNHSILTLKFVAHGTLEPQPIYCPASILENIAHPFRYGMLQNIFHHVLHHDITDRTAMTAAEHNSNVGLTKHTTYLTLMGEQWAVCCEYVMTSSNGNIFHVTDPLCGESPVTGEFPSQRPVMRSFDVFFDLPMNKQLSIQS